MQRKVEAPRSWDMFKDETACKITAAIAALVKDLSKSSNEEDTDGIDAPRGAQGGGAPPGGFEPSASSLVVRTR